MTGIKQILNADMSRSCSLHVSQGRPPSFEELSTSPASITVSQAGAYDVVLPVLWRNVLYQDRTPAEPYEHRRGLQAGGLQSGSEIADV